MEFKANTELQVYENFQILIQQWETTYSAKGLIALSHTSVAIYILSSGQELHIQAAILSMHGWEEKSMGFASK